MAFNFGALPLAAQDPAGGVDLGSALARLTGGGVGYAPAAYPQQAEPAPAPQAPPQIAPQPQAQYKPSKADMFMDMLWNGHSPMEASLAVRQRDAAIYQNQLFRQALQNASPDEMKAAVYGDTPLGKAFADRFGTHVVKGGETLVNGGQGGAPFTGTTYGMDAGQGYALGPNVPGGLQMSQGRLPGDTKVDAESGGLYNNYGPTGQGFSRWRDVAPGNTAGDAFAGIRGVGAPAGFIAPPQAGQPQGPLAAISQVTGLSAPGTAQPAQSGPAGGPRGIRNNNFGNLMALPNGQAWNGQTGVDASGYAVFATPEDGVNAAQKNLQAYAIKHGLNTVSQIVSRWAPQAGGNNTSAYTHFVAGSMGVDPNQKLDMSDPGVQAKLLKGIFSFENGPTTMSAWMQNRSAGPAAKPQAQAQQSGDVAASFTPSVQGAMTRRLSPEEAAAAGFAPGAVVEQKPDHSYSVAQAPEYGPEAKSKLRSDVLNSEDYKQAQASMAAYKAMIGNAKTMTGPAAYAMLDTFARAINPGAVARPQVIETIEKNLGIPAQLVGRLESMTGQGNLPPQIRQQIIDAVVPFAQAHWDMADHLNQANTALAKQHGFSSNDVTAPLDGRPQRMIASPDGMISEADARTQARQAIKAGAPREKVIERLQALRINPTGL